MPLYIQLLDAALNTELQAITPAIVVLLAVGLLTATLQAVFQIEDTTFSLLPKTIAMVIISLYGGFGAVTALNDLARFWISNICYVIGRTWS